MAMGNKESLIDDLMVEADTKMYKAKNRTNLTSNDDATPLL